ncbi:MAG: putative C-S lyase [Chloroflexi bacterium]|nr:putative C-S lyase [Chloroflexota bacterium]
MTYNFDTIIERRQASASYKWNRYDADVLPMYVADMDFKSPDEVLDALRRKVEHGVFGYEGPTDKLSNLICERMAKRYNWHIKPEDIVYLPGLVSGLNVACRAVGQPGDGVLMTTPVYPPFLAAPANHGMTADKTELVRVDHGQTFHYEIDLDAFAKAITPRTKLFMLCHPHNPIGQEWTRAELMNMAEACAKHNLVICSDEIHCELMLGGAKHVPMAALSPEVAQRTITLMAPSKTFNLAGLGCSFAIVQNHELREKVKKAEMGIVPHVNAMGYIAAEAAYQYGDPWLVQMLAYLTANRDIMNKFIMEKMPEIHTSVPNSTYLAWLDCSGTAIEGSPYDFFLSEAKVAFNDGPTFGAGGEKFVRLNFGTTRAQLMDGLHRMVGALEKVQPTEVTA